MTKHEQKPGSAEFRTLRTITMTPAEYDRLVKAAADLGAAEQRRKDAEGAEPVGYVLAGLKELFSNPADPLSAAMILASKDAPHIVPLYTRPANVAALEARVKELEGALSYLKDEALRFASFYPQSSDALNTFLLFAGKIADRAAAIREGGEHG